MKNLTTLIASLIATASIASASITMSGTSVSGAPGLAAGQTGVYVLSNDGSAFSSFDLSAGTVTDSSFYGTSFTVLGSNPVTTGFGTFFGSGHSVTYGSGVDQNDAFALVVWGSTIASAGSTYSYWTDSTWILPADSGSTINFNSSGDAGTFLQLTGAASGSGSIAVPEPSSFALLGGLFALTCVMLRRRA